MYRINYNSISFDTNHFTFKPHLFADQLTTRILRSRSSLSISFHQHFATEASASLLHPRTDPVKSVVESGTHTSPTHTRCKRQSTSPPGCGRLVTREALHAPHAVQHANCRLELIVGDDYMGQHTSRVIPSSAGR